MILAVWWLGVRRLKGAFGRCCWARAGRRYGRSRALLAGRHVVDTVPSHKVSGPSVAAPREFAIDRRLCSADGSVGFSGTCTHTFRSWMALLCEELTEQLAQRSGDEGRGCERREMVAEPFCHGPAQFPCLRRLVLVCPAQLNVSSRRAGPLRRLRVNFLEHGDWQPWGGWQRSAAAQRHRE